MDVATFNLVAIDAKFVKTMTTNEVNRRQRQFLAALVAILLVEIFRLCFHESNIFTHGIDSFCHLFDTILLYFTFFV